MWSLITFGKIESKMRTTSKAKDAFKGQVSKILTIFYFTNFLFWSGGNCFGQSQIKELDKMIAINSAGETFNLSEMQLNSSMMPLDLPCASTGYFQVFAAPGSGFEISGNAVHQARLEVLCAVLNEVSQFISNESGNTINIALSEWNLAYSIVASEQFGSAYWIVPNTLNNDVNLSINDSELWKTLNSDSDALDYFSPTLNSANGGTGGHGLLAFDFNTVNYQYDMAALPSVSQKDFYSSVLKAVLHMFGFASLGTQLNNTYCYSRWDKMIKNADEEWYLPTSPIEPRYVLQPNVLTASVALSNSEYCDLRNKLSFSTGTIPLYNSSTLLYSSNASFMPICPDPNFGGSTVHCASYLVPYGPETNRHPSVHERQILADLDYTLNSVYGSAINNSSFNYGSSITKYHVVGHTDSYVANENLIISNAEAMVNIAADELLANDYHATQIRNLDIRRR
jgi:hypothetical protein